MDDVDDETGDNNEEIEDIVIGLDDDDDDDGGILRLELDRCPMLKERGLMVMMGVWISVMNRMV
jgi:hypothetical protein